MMFLGLDIGTSGVKAIIVDERDRQMASASAPLTVDRPQPLWSEQNPSAWWDATASALDQLASENHEMMAGVAAMGLSGQMLGVTLLDDKDRPIRPALLWNDGRAAAECKDLVERLPNMVDIVGCQPMAGFCAPKILWLSRHEPDAIRNARRILLAKDYVRLLLSGEAISDYSDASATLLMDVRAGKWSPEIAEACGISTEVLPALSESGVIAAHLRKDLALRWNLPANLPIAGGAGDNMSGAIGAGATQKGDAYISLGTSGVYFVANDRFIPAREGGMHTHRHARPGLFAQHGCVLSAASALSWIVDILKVPSIEGFLADIEAKEFVPDEIPVFTPYLSGERTPHNDPLATATFSHLSFATGPLHLGRAVLDGVAFAIADCHDALRDAGAPIERIALIGGGSRSRFWGEIIATVIGHSLHVPVGAELGPALGAARLARQAVGGDLLGPAVQSDLAVIAPIPDWVDAYRERRFRYRAHYPALSCNLPIAAISQK